MRLTQRIAGIDMAGKLGKADYWPTECPPMFADWFEYRDYLLDKLITDPQWHASFRRRFDQHDRQYRPDLGAHVARAHVASILTNDWEGIKLGNFTRRPAVADIRNRRKAEGTWSN